MSAAWNPKPDPATPATAEDRRLAEDGARDQNWKRWGPYLSERQWGTVREDYSRGRRRAGTTSRTTTRAAARIAGARTACSASRDRECRLCFALALWNGSDPILKERLFGLTGPEGNHGEDVKEVYYYLDSTPTHSYMKALYKYPQAEFPYARLVDENRRRGRSDPEFELADTGVFDDDRYFDVFAEYAKAAPERHPDPHHGRQPRPRGGARCTCCRRCGSATPGRGAARGEGYWPKPRHRAPPADGRSIAEHASLGRFRLDARRRRRRRRRRAAVHRERDERRAALRQRRTPTPYVKDAFHEYVDPRATRTR